MFALRLENCDEEEAAEFLEELRAPVDKKVRLAERNIQRWLRG